MKYILKAAHGDPDQTQRSAPFDLGLHCLSMSHKEDAMLIRVKVSFLVMCCDFNYWFLKACHKFIDVFTLKTDN